MLLRRVWRPKNQRWGRKGAFPVNKLILYLWLLDACNSLVTNVRVVRATSLDPLITALHRTSDHQQTRGIAVATELRHNNQCLWIWPFILYFSLDFHTTYRLKKQHSVHYNAKDTYAHTETPTKPCKDTVHALTDLCVISLYLLQIWLINETLLVVDDVSWYSQQVWVVCCDIVCIPISFIDKDLHPEEKLPKNLQKLYIYLKSMWNKLK